MKVGTPKTKKNLLREKKNSERNVGLGCWYVNAVLATHTKQ